MARSRNIKPAFFLNEDLVELSFSTRLLFIGLWCLADRKGRLENRHKKIKMQLFPADDLDVPEALLGLYEAGLINLYTVDSINYIQVNNFNKHQNPHHKEAESVIPDPDLLDKPKALPSVTVLIPDSLLLIPDSTIPEKKLLPENLKVSMPSDFALNDTNRNWINDSGLTDIEKHEVIKDFIDYWTLDESKKTAKGWQMSFRKNPIVKRKIVNSKHRGQNNGSHQQAPKPSLAERVTENRKRAEQQIDEQSMGTSGAYIRT